MPIWPVCPWVQASSMTANTILMTYHLTWGLYTGPWDMSPGCVDNNYYWCILNAMEGKWLCASLWLNFETDKLLCEVWARNRSSADFGQVDFAWFIMVSSCIQIYCANCYKAAWIFIFSYLLTSSQTYCKYCRDWSCEKVKLKTKKHSFICISYFKSLFVTLVINNSCSIN